MEKLHGIYKLMMQTMKKAVGKGLSDSRLPFGMANVNFKKNAKGH